MRRQGPLAVLLFLQLLFATATAAEVSPSAWIAWNQNPQVSQTHRLAGITFTTSASVEGRGPATPRLTVDAEGVAPFEVDGASGNSFVIADFRVFRLGSGRQQPVILFRSFTGGAHCCRLYELIDQNGGSWRVTRLGQWDNGSAPELLDLDGDGELEISAGDQNFLYAFTSYAESLAPRKILRLEDNRLVDVTTDPRFRNVLLTDLVRLDEQCRTSRGRGVCVAYAATAARLGRASEAWRVLDAVFPPTGEKGAESAPNLRREPDGPLRKTFPSFREAVAWYLAELNYLP